MMNQVCPLCLLVYHMHAKYQRHQSKDEACLIFDFSDAGVFILLNDVYYYISIIYECISYNLP